MQVINYYDVYDHNMHFICEVKLKSNIVGDTSDRVKKEIEKKLGRPVEYFKYTHYEDYSPLPGGPEIVRYLKELSLWP